MAAAPFKLVYASVALIVLVVGFQNCGGGFGSTVALSSRSGASSPESELTKTCRGGFQFDTGNTGSVDNVSSPFPGVATVLKGDTHIPVGKCSSAFTLELAPGEVGSTANLVYLSPDFWGQVFWDPDCKTAMGTGVLVALPLKFYVKSYYLRDTLLEASVNGVKTDPLPIVIYKEQFLDVSPSSTGRLYIHDKYYRHVQGTAEVPMDQPPVFDAANHSPSFSPRITDPAQYLLAGLGNGISFDKTKVQIGNDVQAQTVANAVAQTAQATCYASGNKVFCKAGSEYAIVPLPEGNLTDLSSRIAAPTCAVVSGKVFCWRVDLVPHEVTGLKGDNYAVAGNGGYINGAGDTRSTSQVIASGPICGLKKSGLVCIEGQNIILEVPDVTKVSNGDYKQIAVDAKNPDSCETQQKLVDLTTRSSFDLPAEGAPYDELYPLQTASGVKAWSRLGSEIFYLTDQAPPAKLDVEILRPMDGP